jgi:hypothetical protein
MTNQREKDLKGWLKILGGSDDFEDYVVTGISYRKRMDSLKCKKVQKEFKMVVANKTLNGNTCFCYTVIENFHVIKRRGYTSDEYPHIQVGSVCYEKFGEITKDKGGRVIHTVCINCRKPFKRTMKFESCKECRYLDTSRKSIIERLWKMKPHYYSHILPSKRKREGKEMTLHERTMYEYATLKNTQTSDRLGHMFKNQKGNPFTGKKVAEDAPLTISEIPEFFETYNSLRENEKEKDVIIYEIVI